MYDGIPSPSDDCVPLLAASSAMCSQAEDYHQDYYRNNPGQGYCSYVIGPKLEKFKQVFVHKLAAH